MPLRARPEEEDKQPVAFRFNALEYLSSPASIRQLRLSHSQATTTARRRRATFFPCYSATFFSFVSLSPFRYVIHNLKPQREEESERKCNHISIEKCGGKPSICRRKNYHAEHILYSRSTLCRAATREREKVSVLCLNKKQAVMQMIISN